MIQITRHIKTEKQLEQLIREVKRDPAYQNAAQKLVQVFEVETRREVIQDRLDLLQREMPDVQIAGITQTDGKEMVYDFEYKYPGTTYSFFFFAYPESFTVYEYDCSSMPLSKCAECLLQDIGQIGEIKGIQLFETGLELDLQGFFTKLQEKECDYAYFGAQAGLVDFKAEHSVSYAFTERIYEQGLVAIVYHGKDLLIRANYLYGWQPVGKTFTITKQKGTYIQTINNKPAIKFYQKYLGLSDEQQIIMENVTEFPMVMKNKNRLIPRVGTRAGKNGSIQIGGYIPQNVQLQFTYGNVGEILEGTRKDSEELRDFGAQAVLTFPCMNRNIFLRKEKKEETDYYYCCCSQAVVCHGNSEIFMDREGGGLLNSALISVGFREQGAAQPQPERKPCPKDKYAEKETYVPLEKRLSCFLKATTEDMLEAVEEANVANHAKSEFLSRMSHEIRTPINAVLGMDEMILRESREQDIRNYAMDIYTAGNTLLSLINDILDISKIESGKLEILPAEYDLSSMLHDLAAMIAMRAKAKDLKLELSVDAALPSRLYGDDVRIRQVVTNILTNAVKYTQDGSVYFRVTGRADQDRAFVTFEVEDTGIGIKEEDMPKLFQAFERIEENRNRNIEGTGLGMNITVQLLEMMGSRLEVESTYGKGSKFYFTIEQQIVDKTPIGDFEDRVKQLSSEYQYTKSFIAPDAKILVVDDNSLNRKVFMSLLKQTKIQVTEADSGAECLKLAAKNQYDLIFLDHMMPQMDGIETLHRMKELPDCPNQETPVYVLTANAVTGAKEMYLAEGFDGFLSKPVVSEKLEQIIRQELPQNLLQEAEAEQDMTAGDTAVSSLPEDLPVVDGLDWNFAWLHLPDTGLLEETVREFYELIPFHAGKLEEMAAQLETEEGLNAYRIQVHSMKSVAATIGIIPLAGMAATLEYAARDGKTDTIRAMHDVFLDSWRSYREKLEGVFGIGTQEKQEIEDVSLLQAKLEMLKFSMLEMDVDTADPLVEELLTYQYAPDIEEKMQQLKTAVTALEEEEVEQLADELIAALKN